MDIPKVEFIAGIGFFQRTVSAPLVFVVVILAAIGCCELPRLFARLVN
ncbi:MAG: hypothetical protein AAB871_03470 [Patescibacteria group bacterium]